ncbi:Alb1-domain-containing protein [Aspergillus carlsbadensis]|nr:Alb1-domain-containing protein [Aspergillus carlsbadensis]
MAKSKPQSKHSRAARRAASPSVDLDKSLASLPRAEKTELHRESILSERASAGVSKKQSKTKAKSKAQRLRQQKGIERAEAIIDQREIKLAKSNSRARAVKNRRADWSDLNEKAAKFDLLAAAEKEDDDAMIDASAAPAKSKRETRSTHVAQTPIVDEHAPADEDDEIT